MQKGIKEGRIRDDILPEILADFLLGMLRTRAWDLADASEAMRRHSVIVDLFCNGAFALKTRKMLSSRIEPAR